MGKFKVLPDVPLTQRINDGFSQLVVGFAFVSEISDFKIVQILYDLDKDSETNATVLFYTLGKIVGENLMLYILVLCENLGPKMLDDV